MNQEIMCEVEIGTHGSMVEIDGDDQVGVKVTLQGAGWNDVTNLSYFLRLRISLGYLLVYFNKYFTIFRRFRPFTDPAKVKC